GNRKSVATVREGTRDKMSAPHCLRTVARAFLLLATFQFCSFSAAPPCAAQEAPYRGRTLKILVGFPPGGGYDIYARTLARVLPSPLPDMPSVLVVNMPGAVSLTLANYLFNVAPRDGSEIGSVETFIPFEAFFGGSEVRFDPRKFAWIAGLNSEMT